MLIITKSNFIRNIWIKNLFILTLPIIFYLKITLKKSDAQIRIYQNADPDFAITNSQFTNSHLTLKALVLNLDWELTWQVITGPITLN